MPDENIILFVLPLLAILVSLFLVSKTARRLLFFGGLYFLVSFSVSWLLNQDCGFNDWAFTRCDTIPQIVAEIYTVLGLINLAAYTFLAPPLLLLAVVVEFRVRRRRSYRKQR